MNKSTVGIIALIVIAASTVLIVYFLKDDSNTRITYCGADKTNPVNVFVNPDKAFPAFANSYTVKLNAGVSLLDTLKEVAGSSLSAGSEVHTQIVELREKLNQDNIRMENLMRASFYAYNSRPCDAEVSRRYLNMLDTLSLKITELERLKVSLVEPQKGGDSSTSMVVAKRRIISDSDKVKRALVRLNSVFLKNDQPR